MLIKEIITEMDNWFIVKLLGGFTIIIILLLKGFSKLFMESFNRAIQNFFDKNLQKLKGEIDKNNTLLNSLTQNHLLTSQKIIDKKIKSYDILWNTILKIKSSFPTGINMVHKILHDNEFNDDSTITKLKANYSISITISSYKTDIEMTKITSLASTIYEVRPYISDDAMKYFYAYHGIVGRICYKFLDYWNINKLYNWKNDPATLELLSVSLNPQELTFILEQKYSSLETLFEVLEYKIVNDLKMNLNIKNDIPDTIEHLKEIEKLLLKNDK